MIGLTRQALRRAREERLPQAAGSLTFTTVLAAVPLLAVSFALFTHIPWLRQAGATIQEQLLRGMLPADVGRMVLRHLGRFAANAHGLGWVGSLLLLAGAMLLLFTVENTLNRIWQVKKDRPLHRRLGIHLAMLVTGPPALGASLWATSWLLAASAGWLRTLPSWGAFALNLGPVLLGMACLASLFYFVPNTQVRRRDALAGGLLASIAFELGKRGFGAFVLAVPTYRTLYGAFAAVPVFLLWVYFSWLVTLASAVLVARPGRGGKAVRKPARGQPRK